MGERRGKCRRDGGIAGALAWLAGFVRGFHSAATASADERRAATLSRWTRRWKDALRREFAEDAVGTAEEERAMESLRHAVLGMPRAAVVEVLGVPGGTSAQDRPGNAAGGYWRARTWYYPLSARRRTAVAVNFTRDVVSAVEQLAGPHI